VGERDGLQPRPRDHLITRALERLQSDCDRPRGSRLEDVVAADEELQAAGYELLHPARQKPWGQTVARMLSCEELIIGISYAPALHE